MSANPSRTYVPRCYRSRRCRGRTWSRGSSSATSSPRYYLSYLVDRPDSVVAALRAIAYAPGATLVHCAAGKDRTGTLVALALSLAGVERDAVVADYVASSERVEQVVARLMASATYVDNLRGRPISSHLSQPQTMITFLDHLDWAHGGPERLLITMGWTVKDTAALRAKLRD